MTMIIIKIIPKSSLMGAPKRIPYKNTHNCGVEGSISLETMISKYPSLKQRRVKERRQIREGCVRERKEIFTHWDQSKRGQAVKNGIRKMNGR